jgi:ElaA protein
MKTSIKHFSELSAKEFHDMLQLRIDVFVVEQNCPYPELDGKDINAYHFIGKNEDGETVATCRILPKGVSYPELSIGRFASAKKVRQEGFGLKMMEEVLDFIEINFGNEAIRISAQKYLVNFYSKFGFVSTGKEYLEDDIPHVEMLLP